MDTFKGSNNGNAAYDDKTAAAAERICAFVIADMANHRPAESGEGKVVCPLCGGNIFFAWRKYRRDPRRKQVLSFACETKGCLRGAGH